MGDNTARKRERNPEKQLHIEKSLGSLKSKMYGDYSGKVKSGIYRKNRNTLKKNLRNLEKEKNRLTRKKNSGSAKQAKGYNEKIKKLETLQEIMGEETNVENLENNSNNESTPLGTPQENEELEGLAEELNNKAVIENENENNLSNLPTLEKVTPPLEENILEEMREGENAVQAVKNVKAQEAKINNNTRSVSPIRARENINVSIKNNKENDIFEEQKKNFITQLKGKLKDCEEECKKMKTELDIYTSIEERKKFSNFELNVNATLFDLLTKRILDPDDNWKNKIDILVNIPTSIKSNDKILRGGDYMEALFQLAIAINILEQFKSKYIKMYDIDKYKKIAEFEGSYLYEKGVLNSGGGEKVQGISDITFEVSEQPFDKKKETIKGYKCGDPTSVKDINIQNKMFFVSVKGFVKEKSIKKDYDIPLLYMQTQFFENSDIKVEKILAVGVKNGDEFRERLDKTRIDFLPKSVRENVFSYKNTTIEKGILDLFEDFRRDFFIKYPSKELIDIENKIKELYPKDEEIKPTLSLYYHQELVSRAVINRINTEIRASNDKKLSKPHFMCIGVLPRGGKSYIAGGIIKMYEKQLNKDSGFNVLFMTSAVTETISQFKDDLIDKFADFNDYSFVDIRNIKENPGNKKNKFIFCSRQFATGKEKVKVEIDEEDDTKIETQMKDVFKLIEQYANSIDLVFFDEAHIAVLKPNMQKNFTNSFKKFKAPIILMTATYKKPVNILSGKNDLFVWDLFDIKDMRSLPEIGYELFIKQKDKYDVMSRYGELAIKILEERKALGQSDNELAKPYINFPEPHFVSPTFTPEIIEKINGIGGFSYNDIFAIQPIKANIDNFNLIKDTTKWKEWYTLLQNYEHAQALKSYITYNSETTNAFKDIFNHSQLHGTIRPRFDRPFSVLMFLPLTSESVSALCRIWASFLLKEKFWKDNFIILTLSEFNDKEKKKGKTATALAHGGYVELEQIGGADGCEDDIICFREKIKGDNLKGKIVDLERKALERNKGLLLLSGDVAKMGISLPCVDVVFMLDKGTEPDDIIQKMFRALTDSPGKKFGYIVDTNIKRIIEAFFIYDLEKDKQNPKSKRLQDKNEKRLNKIAEAFNWGYDSFISNNIKKLDYEDIMNIIKNKILGNLEDLILNTLVKKIKDETDFFIEETELGRELFDLVSKTSLTKTKKENSEEFTQGDEIANKPKEERNAGETKKETKKEKSELEKMMKDDEKKKELIKKKILNIQTTFINSMLIRNDTIPWNKEVTIDKLLNQYSNDKKSAIKPVKCKCDNNNSCSYKNNIYERVYCEVLNYTDKDEIKANELIRLLERIIDEEAIIKHTWNNYIESFIKKIDSVKNIKKSSTLGNV